jgi:predicted transcriptional regulator
MSFRLKPELKAKLQSLADADRRSLTNYVEVLLEQHVEMDPSIKNMSDAYVAHRKRKGK